MTTQIAVRLSDELVSFVDEEVSRGHGSRAAVVTAALVELRRHRAAERDAQIVRETGDYPDLAGLTATPSPDLSDLD